MERLLRDLGYYNPENRDKIKFRKEVLECRKIFEGRNFIVLAFEENIFVLLKETLYQHEEWAEKE